MVCFRCKPPGAAAAAAAAAATAATAAAAAKPNRILLDLQQLLLMQFPVGDHQQHERQHNEAQILCRREQQELLRQFHPVLDLQSILKEDQIKLNISAQTLVTQHLVLSEPKAVRRFNEGDRSLNYLVLRLSTTPATQNIKSRTHLIKQRIIKME